MCLFFLHFVDMVYYIDFFNVLSQPCITSVNAAGDDVIISYAAGFDMLVFCCVFCIHGNNG